MKLKKSVKRILIIAIILIITGLGFIVYESLNPKDVKKATVENEIPEYGYTLKSTRNARYKKMFQELKDILSKDEVDEEAYLKQISKMFLLENLLMGIIALLLSFFIGYFFSQILSFIIMNIFERPYEVSLAKDLGIPILYSIIYIVFCK